MSKETVQQKNTAQQPDHRPPAVENAPAGPEAVAALSPAVSAGGLPVHPTTQRLRQARVLHQQHTLGNRFVQRQMAQAAITRRPPAAQPVVQRQGGGGSHSALPDKAPDAAGLVAAQFPQLKLPPESITILQKILDARLALLKGEDRKKGLNVVWQNGSYQGDSADARKAEQIDKELAAHSEHLRRHPFFSVPTSAILGNDILSHDKDDKPAEIAFRDSLYKTMISHPTELVMGEGYNPSPVFTLFKWGPGKWVLTHKEGLVMFDNLMRLEKFNLAWQRVLLGEQIELTEHMLEISKGLGGKPVDAMGKKLGETYGHFWNTTVKVMSEISPIGGYYDDPDGRMELSTAYLNAKGARCVIRGPDNWMHIFSLTPFTVNDMKGLITDDYGYLLTDGGQVTAERVTTGDGFELALGSGPTGTGWRTKQILSELEQFAIGAIIGDFMDDPSGTMIMGQIVIGCVPIVGQIADARDVAAGIAKMWQTGGKDGKLQTALALVGFIPVFGDAVKLSKEAFQKGGREAANAIFAKTVREGAPEATNALAKQIIKDPEGIAAALKISKAEMSELGDMAKKALDEGGEAAEKYAAKMTELYDNAGGNALAVVVAGGGSWSGVAKALAASPTGEALGKKMQAWRVQQFDGLEQRIKQKATDFGQDLESAGAPQMARTGTPSFLSDVDVSFLGPHAT
ncbi:MAG: hypothetical protein L0322_24915, partial [Chloroflexi bacterium]|nr:hypothetical protein [Chloroflexota bacterium]